MRARGRRTRRAASILSHVYISRISRVYLAWETHKARSFEARPLDELCAGLTADGRGVAIVLGNEVTGVDKAVMEECDAVVEIPVFGVKNSLNVACCASVALYEVLRRWGKWESRVER